MANAAETTNIWNCPNYVGEIYQIGGKKTPFLNMIGGLQGGNVKTIGDFEFTLAQPWALENASQPAISETDSLTAPTPTTYVRGQDKNTVQIFQEQVSISYAKQSVSGQVRVDEIGDEIVGHESVFDDNTEERYYLMKECRMNFSPILAEYNEDDTAIHQILVDYIEKNLSLIEIEHAGETHSLWDIGDSNLRENIIRSLKGQRLMILDGHHRYTASRRLAKDDGVKHTMMMLVGGHDPNLLLLPWHRCIKGVSRDMLSKIVKEHEEARYEDYDTFIRAFNTDEDINSAMYDGSGFHIIKDLDIFKLHEIVIDPLIESKGEISFLPTIKDAVDAVDQGRCTASFIVKPPKIGTVEEMAHRGVSLPQKSTRFLPKVIEGIIMRRF